MAHNVENNCVIQPVIACTVRVLSRDSDGVVLRRQPAVECELDVEFITSVKAPDFLTFNPGIGTVYVNADAVSNENANQRLYLLAMETASNPNGNALAAFHRG